jgi:hypothetical protein
MYQPIHQTDDLESRPDRLTLVETTPYEAGYEARPISDLWLAVASVFVIAVMAIVLYALVSPLANL